MKEEKYSEQTMSEDYKEEEKDESEESLKPEDKEELINLEDEELKETEDQRMKEPETEPESKEEIKDEESEETKTEDDEDDFIFSSFEEIPKEKIKNQNNKEETQTEEDIKFDDEDNMSRLEITERNEEEPIRETKIREEKPLTEEENIKHEGMNEALELLKKQVILSEQAITETINQRLESIGETPGTNFEEAVQKIKHKVRIPFITELRKIHKLKQKAEKGENIEIEDASMALRTAKNFLNIFE